MIELAIPDMSCSHCVGVITKTVRAIDKDAQLDVDLDRHVVRVTSSAAPEELLVALADADYPATVV